ncbi:MAG: hypothetical protein IJ806_08565 [Ruminococcus sp.]|nr:hypothetical protein [Ruminococcus sp.]
MRRNIISRLEEENSIPERLSPENIRAMLEKRLPGPIIGAKLNEVRLNGRKQGLLRAAAAAAVMVIAFGGLAISGMDRQTTPAPNSPAAEESVRIADTQGLSGLRGATYNSLYNYLKGSVSESHSYRDGPDNAYILTADDKLDVDDETEIARQFRDYYDRYTVDAEMKSVRVVTQKGFDSPEVDMSLRPELVKSDGKTVFVAGLSDIAAYTADGDHTRRIEKDFFEGTYFRNTMGQNAAFQAKNHTLKPYIIGMYLKDEVLTVLFDFHNVEEMDTKLVVTEYCGICAFDVSNADDISLIYEFEQPGTLKGSGLTEDGSLAIVSEYFNGKRRLSHFVSYKEGEVPAFAPFLFDCGSVEPVPEDSIYIANKNENSAMTYMSSFSLSTGRAERTGTLLMTCFCESLVTAGDSFYLCNTYLGKKEDERVESFGDGYATYYADPQSHIIRADYGDKDRGIAITAAKYPDSIFGTFLTDCSMEEGRLYLCSSDGAVYVFDKDLEELTDLNGYDSAYNSTGFNMGIMKKIEEDQIYVGYTSGIPVLDGSDVYYFDCYDDGTLGLSAGGGCVCRCMVDLSDPDKPDVTYYDLDGRSQSDAPALEGDLSSFWYGRTLFTDLVKMSNKEYLSVYVQPKENYEDLGEEDNLYERYLALRSLDPEDSFTYTDHLNYGDEEHGMGKIKPQESYTARAAGIKDSIKLSDDMAFSSMTTGGGGSLGFSTMSLYSKDAGAVFMPHKEKTVSQHEITQEEYEALTYEDMGRFYAETENNEDGTFTTRYYYIDEIEIKNRFRGYGVSGGRLTDLGDFSAGTWVIFDDRISDEVSFVGTYYKDGYLYAFTTATMAVTDMETGETVFEDGEMM